MVAAEIIMLSVLRAGPVHGYELKRRVQRTSLSTLSNNSIYPILRRFEQDGIVSRSDESQDGKPDRKVYSITAAGRALMTELISTLPANLASNEEEFLVRVGFFHELQPAQRRAIIAARSAVLDASIAQLNTLLSETKLGPGRDWRNLTLRRRADDFERERQWITELDTKAGS